MNRFIISIIFLFLISCDSKPNFYHGYVYDSVTHKPISNIKVEAELSKDLVTHTDTKGYFKIEKKKHSIEKYFILSNSELVLDTIQVFWVQHGETITYSFVEGKNDTIFINFHE